MAGIALKQKQAPIKELYRSDPERAIVTLRSSGTLDSSGITCSLDSGPMIQGAKQRVAGLHRMAGGPEVSGELCSGEMLLEALVACAGVTLKAVATALQIPLKSGTIQASADLDFKGTLGVDENAPVGLTSICLSFELEIENGAQVSDSDVEALGTLTERYCVVLQTIVHKPRVTVQIQGWQTAEDGTETEQHWVKRC